MSLRMIVGDIFMVIIPTGRRTGEALRGFAPPALSPYGSRVPKHQPFAHLISVTEHQPFCVGDSMKYICSIYI
jgi:hypothetical protein